MNLGRLIKAWFWLAGTNEDHLEIGQKYYVERHSRKRHIVNMKPKAGMLVRNSPGSTIGKCLSFCSWIFQTLILYQSSVSVCALRWLPIFAPRKTNPNDKSFVFACFWPDPLYRLSLLFYRLILFLPHLSSERCDISKIANLIFDASHIKEIYLTRLSAPYPRSLISWNSIVSLWMPFN